MLQKAFEKSVAFIYGFVPR